MSPLYFWIATAIIFLIIEMLTSTFYGLAISLAAAIVAGVAYMTHDTSLTLLQGWVFALASIIFSVTLPRLLSSGGANMPQWADRYIGQVRSVRKVGWEWKISLDGVDYPIDSDDEIIAWDKVEVLSHHGVSMKVKKAK